MSVELFADRWAIRVTETRSTGEYENVQASASVEGEFPEATRLDADARLELVAKLLAAEKALLAVVERTADNRTKATDDRDWGVPSRD